MKINSFLSYAMASILFGSMAMTADAQSISGQTRGGGQANEAKGKAKGQSQDRRGNSEVPGQSEKKRQDQDRGRTSGKSSKRDDDRKDDKRSQDDRRASNERRQRESDSKGRVSDTQRRDAESRARSIANQREAEEKKRADDRRREEANRRSREDSRRRDDIRRAEYDRGATVGGLTGNRNQDWFRDSRVNSRIRDIVEPRNRRNDEWDRVFMLPAKSKKASPPPWSNSRHNRDVFYVNPASRRDDRDDRHRKAIFVRNDPWYDNDQQWQVNNDPYLQYSGYSSWQDAYDRRQDKKNEWRNIAYVSGAVLAYGLLNKDETLTFAGAAGALYSVYRYEEDRKSQNDLKRLRAEYFSRDYFERDGVRYERRLVTKGKEKYYQFHRA